MRGRCLQWHLGTSRLGPPQTVKAAALVVDTSAVAVAEAATETAMAVEMEEVGKISVPVDLNTAGVQAAHEVTGLARVVQRLANLALHAASSPAGTACGHADVCQNSPC
jgi:hypothetical protein